MRCPVCGCTLISIHALLAESDFYRNPVYHNHRKFLSTLSLRRATLPSRTALEALLFLSTLSLRRATIFSPALPTLLQYFYPRSPCGERPLIAATFNPETGISIHALLAESDSGSVPRCAWHNLFLSTLSLRRATTGTTSAGKQQSISIHALLAESDGDWLDTWDSGDISIHALLAESDGGCPCHTPPASYFYPRSPCGERQTSAESLLDWAEFLSTLSLRRATWQGADLRPRLRDFYPRSPCGERLPSAVEMSIEAEFLSTLSLRRATHSPPRPPGQRRYFYPRSPCGERPADRVA